MNGSSGGWRRWPASLARLLVVGLALTGTPAGTPAMARDALPPWPPAADGPLANDPGVTWGRLANGVRYAIMPNQTPPGQVSLRLLIRAGSLMEAEDQRGLAHFLEHMAFKGSENLAPGEFVRFLQRAGLAFGPDTNASTSFDSTIYQLDLPRNDITLVGEGIGILSEVAGRLTLAPDQIETERGVILSEKRQRDTPGTRLFEQTLGFLMPGTRLAERSPIGLEQVIKEAPRERFLAFYRDYYTPGRSIVVVAGDVTPADVAPLIERHFAGFREPDPAAGDPAPGTLPQRGLDAILVSDPGLPATVSLNRVLPFDPTPDSLAKQDRKLRRGLANAMVGRRLESIGLRQGAPFRDAGIGSFDLPPTAEIATMRLQTTPERWRDALAAGEQQLRLALEHGFTAQELDQIRKIVRNRLESVAASAATRESDDLADQIVDAVSEDEVYTSPAADVALFDQLTANLQPADLTAALREMWDGEPQIILSGPMQLAEPKADILAAYAASRSVATGPAADNQVQAFPYTEFGTPSPVAARTTIDDLGITRVTFANGVRLDMKATPFEADTIHVAVRFGNGRLGMPPQQPGLDLLARWGFLGGGLGRLSLEELTRSLAAYQIDADLIVGDTSLALTGGTRPQDLPLQLSLLAAYLTDPGYRPEAEERYRQQLEAAYARQAAVPEGAVAGPVARFLHGGDERFALPPEEVAQARTLAELRAWLTPALCCGPLQVAVVGDIDPERVIAEVGRTFGALPQRAAPEKPQPAAFAPPSSREPLRFTHAGPDSRAMALVYWPNGGRRDARHEIGLDLVADILSDRLLDEVRGREGATYSPEAFSDTSWAIPDYGYLAAALDVATGDAARLGQLMVQVGADMRAGPITQDEFERALQPRLAQARQALESNEYWLYRVLIGLEQYPERLDDARRLIADHESQTLASVQELAGRYLDPAKALPVLILPNSGGGAAAEEATGAL